MNIIKLQNELKNVPDQALIGYVQNPTGQVPSYLALSELQRRKEMRDNYKAAKPEKSTVAEDLAEPQPQGIAAIQQSAQAPVAEQGVAGLPVPDQMFSGKGMAQGGIVAFDDGGEVATSRFGDWLQGIKSSSQADLAKQDQIQRLQSEYLSLTTSPFTKITPSQSVSNKARQAEIKQQIAQLTNSAAPISTAPTATVGGPRVDNTQLPPSFTGINAPSQFNVSPNAINQMSAPPVAPVAKAAGPDLGGLYQPLKDYSSEYAALYQDPAGAAERDMARYNAMIGKDTLRPELEKKLAKMEERAAKTEEQAPWMALAKAGLGMAAGKSPYALQNIAEGATMGLKDYSDTKDKLETTRDKQFDLQARIAQSQRAEQVAAATYGLNSEQHIKAQNQANKLAELGYKTNREALNQKNKIDAFEAVNKGKLEGAQADYYKEKGPSGDVTEKDLWKGYVSSGGELVNGPWDAYKLKYMPKAIPTDITGLLNKYK
jgi:hypothetical protein